jgi:hypothetical protein
VTEATWGQSAREAGSEEQRDSWPSYVGRGEEEERRGEEVEQEMLTEISQIAFRER